MATRNNRRAGHKFECYIANEFVEAGWERCRTTRNAGSKAQDDAGVDLTGCGYTVQCKYTQTAPNMQKLLQSMPGTGFEFNEGIRVVFHKRANSGTTVTMSEQDFFEIIKRLRIAESPQE